MGKTHKLVGNTTETYCPVWLGFNSRGGMIGMADEYYASRWWKYVTCKLCLRSRPDYSPKGNTD